MENSNGLTAIMLMTLFVLIGLKLGFFESYHSDDSPQNVTVETSTPSALTIRNSNKFPVVIKWEEDESDTTAPLTARTLGSGKLIEFHHHLPSTFWVSKMSKNGDQFMGYIHTSAFTPSE